MKREHKISRGIIIRYALIIIIAFLFPLVYLIFTPLTLYPVYWILGVFYSTSIEKTALVINGSFINLIQACIAGSAYFLLVLLNLSTPNIKKRAKALAFGLGSFLAANIIRIIVLTALFLSNFAYFVQAHLISWYFLTAIFVILIWIATIKIFNIKEIPFYSDFKYLKNMIEKKKL